MNALLYIFGILSSVALSISFILIGIEEPALRELLLGAPLPMIGVAIINSVMLYNVWAAIEGSEAPTTGGAAAGLIWVPLFNLYWVFQVIPGFATNYNRTIPPRSAVAAVAAGSVSCISSAVTGAVVGVDTPVSGDRQNLPRRQRLARRRVETCSPSEAPGAATGETDHIGRRR